MLKLLKTLRAQRGILPAYHMNKERWISVLLDGSVPLEQALALLPHARYALPYEGAREMLLVEEPEDRQSLCALVRATYDALPAPRPRKKRQV